MRREGEPDAGDPHVRSDGREVETGREREGAAESSGRGPEHQEAMRSAKVPATVYSRYILDLSTPRHLSTLLRLHFVIFSRAGVITLMQRFFYLVKT